MSIPIYVCEYTCVGMGGGQRSTMWCAFSGALSTLLERHVFSLALHTGQVYYKVQYSYSPVSTK